MKTFLYSSFARNKTSQTPPDSFLDLPNLYFRSQSRAGTLSQPSSRRSSASKREEQPGWRNEEKVEQKVERMLQYNSQPALRETIKITNWNLRHAHLGWFSGLFLYLLFILSKWLSKKDKISSSSWSHRANPTIVQKCSNIWYDRYLLNIFQKCIHIECVNKPYFRFRWSRLWLWYIR